MQTRSVAEKLFDRLETLDPADERTFVRRLIDERFFFEEMINILEEGIIVIDKKRNVAQINKAARHLLGAEGRRKVLGAALLDLIGDQSLKTAVAEILETPDAKSRIEVNTRYPKARTFNVHARRMPITREKSEGESVMVFVIDDVTDIKQREEDRRRREQTESLATLTAGVAHEIKNPLNALSIHNQLMERALKNEGYLYNDSERERLKHSAGVIAEELKRLQNITENFLSSARPVRPIFALYDINTLIESVLALLEPELAEMEIEVNFDPSANLPSVHIDESQMRQALLNILSNCIDALEDSSHKQISIRTFEKENTLCVEIADTGIGIEPENVVKIFEPYFTTKFAGTGLGLFQVYRVAQMHRAEILVDSEPDKGTKVAIYLPLIEKKVQRLTGKKRESTHETESGS